MTSIKIFRNKNRDIVKYEVSGHSGFDEYGRDILCASLSVLSQTTILSLEKVCEISQDDIELCIDEETGYLSVSLSKSLTKELRDKANIVLETMFVGMEDIALQYPKYINLMVKEAYKC